MINDDFERMVLALPEREFQTPPFTEIRLKLLQRRRHKRLVRFVMATAAGVLLGFCFVVLEGVMSRNCAPSPAEELRLSWDGTGELAALSDKITELKQNPWRVAIVEQ